MNSISVEDWSQNVLLFESFKCYYVHSIGKQIILRINDTNGEVFGYIYQESFTDNLQPIVF